MISIVICTFNGALRLSNVIESVCKLIVPENLDLELIIVDNNSSDNTGNVAKRLLKEVRFKSKYVFEANQGLSFARNAGIRESEGDIIAFTDDDIIVDPNWLAEIVNAFVRYDADCVGGKVLPVWPGKRPPWLSKIDENILALLDYGENVLQISIDDPPLFGANIAFSRRILNEVGKFTTSLGRRGSKLYCGEDTDMFARVLKSKGKIIYQPKAIVNHVISETRLKKAYFRKWHFDAGEGLGINLGHYSKRNILGVPYYIIKEFFLSSLIYLRTYMSFKRDSIFHYELKLIFYYGYITGRMNTYINNLSHK